MASPALMRSPLIRDRSDPRMVRERGASLYGTPRGGELQCICVVGWGFGEDCTLEGLTSHVSCPCHAHHTGRGSGNGMRVGSYTPASYGSVTTFAPGSYQYRVRSLFVAVE